MAGMMTSTNLLAIASIVLLALSPSVADESITKCKGVVNLTAEDPFWEDDYYYLMSPDFNESHPSKIDCEVHITADSNSSVVVVELMYFQVDEDQPDCTKDRMEFYDGSNTSYPRIKQFCGNMSGEKFNSTNSDMTIIFHSDGLKRNNTGFKLEYYSRIKPKDPNRLCNSGTLPASENVNYLTSPDYTSGMNCQWIITAPDSSLIDLHPVEFDLGDYDPTCSSDSLTLYDGNSTSYPIIRALCGSHQFEHYKSSGPYMTLVFHTSSYGENAFKLEYKSLVKSVICPNTTITATGTSSNITSPDYPNRYPSKMDCQWVITADEPSRVIALSVWTLYLANQGEPPGCNNDHVSIYDGNSTNSPKTQLLCQYLSRGKFISSGNSMTVVFHSDENISFEGFNFAYTSQDKSDVCINSRLMATNVQQYITSPGYPKNYSSFFDCQWNITAASSWEKVVLAIVSFDVDSDSYLSDSYCPFDYVSVDDGFSRPDGLVIMCGHHSIRKFTSFGPHMTVKFYSYGLQSYMGFKFVYTSQLERVPCADNYLSASLTAKDLISSNYPTAYPSIMDCKWIIQAGTNYVIVLKLKKFNLATNGKQACGSDYVEVYDGSLTNSNKIASLCGQQSDGQFNSTTNYMTVSFHSEGGNSSTTGFYFTYQSIKKSNTGVLVTAQIAFVPFVLLIFQILY